MLAPLPPLNLTAAQRELWQRVNELWALSAQKDALRIRDALHPEYMGLCASKLQFSEEKMEKLQTHAGVKWRTKDWR